MPSSTSADGSGPPRRGRRALFWIATLAVPLGLALALTELGLRLLWPERAPQSRHELDRRLAESQRTEVDVVTTGNLKGLVQPAAHPELIYELKPSRRWIFQGARTETNRHGFRGREYAVDKSPGTLRVAGLGDSVMFGWGVEQDAVYTVLLEQRLSAALAVPVEVLNFAVPGYNATQEALTLQHKALAFAPDAILVNYTANDWQAPFFVRDPQKDGIVESSVVLDLVRGGVLRLREGYVTDLQGADKVVDALQRIVTAARHVAAPAFFVVFPHRLSADDNASLRRQTEQLGFHFVDLLGPFERAIAERGLSGLDDFAVAPGDFHPDARGHAVIAEALEAPLAEALRARLDAAATTDSVAAPVTTR